MPNGLLVCAALIAGDVGDVQARPMAEAAPSRASLLIEPFRDPRVAVPVLASVALLLLAWILRERKRDGQASCKKTESNKSLPERTIRLVKDSTDERRAEPDTEVEDLQKRLTEASRQALTAEIATGVLHNVANALNSINVSINVLNDRIRNSEIGNLRKVAELLAEHKGDLGAYLQSDPKGVRIPAFIQALADQLAEEHQTLGQELEVVQKGIDHIKEIVATQQSYAKLSGVVEKLPLASLVEDALRMNSGALARHGIKVVKEFEAVPEVLVEKNKVLQILINLIRNAKYAMDEHGPGNKQLTLRVRRAGAAGVRVEVIDTGIGVAPEDQPRLFEHGFTTRKDGHGFGLHSAAVAAKELGGSLSAISDGVGKGATFTLEIPLARDLAMAA